MEGGREIGDRDHRVTEGLIDEKQGSFRSGRGSVDQIFTIKEISEKPQEKNVGYIWV